MNNNDFLNLYVYSDSLAFRRVGQQQDISFTYPFILKNLIETRLGIRANLMLRGGPTADVGRIRETIERDSGYWGGDDQALNVVIVQVGIVDCAPRPITYFLSPVLQRTPVIGKKILSVLQKYRRRIQLLWSYTITPARRFKKEYALIVAACYKYKFRPIAIGMPLPPLALEQRSPGFRRNTNIYNQIIREVIPESFCDIEQVLNETMREKVLLPDGHHLTEEGHKLFAENLFDKLQKSF